jgi:hypothetical protein
MTRPVFISYAREAAAAPARRLHEALGEELAFLDSRALEYGRQFPEELLDALLASRIVVLFVDDRYLQRAYCLWELYVALQPYKLLPFSAPEAEKRAALAHLIIARAEGPASSLERLPPLLRSGGWPAREDVAALKALVLESLARTSEPLGERLARVEPLPTLRARLLSETAIPAPMQAVGIRQFPHDLEASLHHRFVGRADELWRIDSLLSARGGEPAAAALTTGLEGGGGVGKTRLALEYLHRFGPRRFPGGLFWVDAAVSEDRLEEQLHGILRELEPGTPPLKVLREQQVKVSKELARVLNHQPPGQPILYVIDNIPEPPAGTPPQKLRTWCPAPGKVALLITSRLRFSIGDKSVQAVQVGSLSPGDAVLMLTEGLETSALADAEWREIAAWVGHLPLALQLLNGAMDAGGLPAGVLLERSRTKTTTQELDRQMKVLRGVVPETTLRGVTDAFLFSYNQLSTVQRDCARVLAWLAPEPVPDAVLWALGPDVAGDETRTMLRARSFVSPAPGGKVPLYGTMHRVLADFLRSMTAWPEEELRLASRAVIDAMAEHEAADPARWPLLNACLPHAESLFEQAMASTSKDLTEDAVRLGLLIGNLLAERGLSHEAERLCERVAKKAVKVLGSEHRLTFIARNNLGQALQEVGDVHGARALLESVLEVQARALGFEHPNTLATRDSLAHALLLLGDVATALRHLDQVVESRTRTLGAAHVVTLAAMNHRNSVLYKMGRVREAREGQQRLLELQTPLKGEEHPHTLKARSNLARYLLADKQDKDKAGSIAQARSIFEEVLSVRRRTLGERHPDTLEAMANLGAALCAQGDYAAARQLQEEELSRTLERLDEATHEVISSRVHLAMTLSALGDHASACSQYVRALAASKKFHGPRHPETTVLAWQLFLLYCKLRDRTGSDSVLYTELQWLIQEDPASLSPEQQEIGLEVFGILSRI